MTVVVAAIGTSPLNINFIPCRLAPTDLAASHRWSVVAVIISAIVAWVHLFINDMDNHIDFYPQMHYRHQSAQYQLHSLPTGAHGPGCIPSNFAAGLRIETSAQGIWNLMTRWLCSLANIGDTKTYTMLTGPSDHSLPTGAHGPGCIPSNFAAGLRIETNLRGRC
jgi:hypothetical protein